MTAALSSRLRLLVQSPPFDRIDPNSFRADEDKIQAWQLNIGQEVAQEGVPFGFVCLVVEGGLRVTGKDVNGEPFTIRRLHSGEWWGLTGSLQGVSAATCRTTEASKLLAVPVELWQTWWSNHSALKQWIASHLQREDIYAGLRPVLMRRALQDRSFLELIDNLLPGLISRQIVVSEDLQALKESPEISWLIPSSEHCLPEEDTPTADGFSTDLLEKAFNRSIYGLRLLGFPKASLQELFVDLPSKINKQDASSTGSSVSEDLEQSGSEDPTIDLPAWQNPDGVELLASALEQQDPRPRSDKRGLIVRPILGSSPVEQGLALLQMVSEVLRVPFRRDVVERMMKGMIGERNTPSLEILGQIADGLGLSAVLMPQIPPPHLDRVANPALLELPNGEGIALIAGSKDGSLRVIDPQEGERWLSLESLAKEQGFYRAVTICRRPESATKRFDISYFFPYLQRYRNSLILVFVASLFINIFSLAQPLLIQQIIDKVIGQQNFNTLYFIGVLLIGTSILSNVLGLIRAILFTDTTNRIDIATSGNILNHLFRLPLGYFDKRPVGEISTRIAELGNIRGFLTGTALTLILDTIFGALYFFVLISYSGLLTAVALAVVPLYIALIFLVAPIIKRQLRIAAEANATASALMVESLTGIQTVKAQHAETNLRWKWQQRYARYISANFRTALIGASSGAIGQFFRQVGGLAVLWVGAYLVLKGDLTVGQLIAFNIISGNVVGPIINLASTWQTVQGLQISIERLSDVVDAPTEQPMDVRPIALPPIKGKVEFENVNFRFKTHAPLVVKSVSFMVDPGCFVGIVGQSGSGKSTIMKLLPRLYPPTEGLIRIDDYDIAKVDLDSLRQQIGIVPQDSMLFDGSIRENICLNAPDASDDEVIQAARVACAHAFIMDLPNGYGSNVGERGASLSGGQRQRIAIARAILARPRLLILDEATSALDYLTEKTLCENLMRELAGDTVFFITHRLATIRSADKIMLMENGLLQEVGTHQQLLARKGLYYALYRQQDASIK